MGWAGQEDIVRVDRRLLVIGFAIELGLALAVSLRAQAPSIQNADFSTRPAGGSLKAGVEALAGQAGEPVWIGYSVPRIAGDGAMCCYQGGWDGDGGCCRGCRLEDGKGSFEGGARAQTVQLEPARELLVLLRAAGGKLDRVRAFSSDCPLDAGGRRVVWLSGADAGQSVDYLAELVRGSDWSQREEKRLADGALAALAQHAGSRADSALAGFLAAGGARRLRKQTAFWLCTARGASGFEAVRKAVRSDDDAGFRKEAMFAFSVSRESAAIEELIRSARNDSSGEVRKQALFWLAQKAGKASATLTEAIERDPDTDVKKHAVFALSQLPKDEGVPLLIQVARNNTNPAVRKQAVFWLGQSDDARALQFFEEVLSK
jgi:HEAT repeats